MIGAFRALGLSTSPSPFYPCWAVLVEGLPGHLIKLSQWCTCANNHKPPTCAAASFDIISCIWLFFTIYDTVLIVITCVQTKRITKTLCMFTSLFFSFDQMEIKTFSFCPFFFFWVTFVSRKRVAIANQFSWHISIISIYVDSVNSWGFGGLLAVTHTRNICC